MGKVKNRKAVVHPTLYKQDNKMFELGKRNVSLLSHDCNTNSSQVNNIYKQYIYMYMCIQSKIYKLLLAFLKKRKYSEGKKKERAEFFLAIFFIILMWSLFYANRQPLRTS